MAGTVSFVTLGCKLNYAETSTYTREFREGGFIVVPSTQKADVYVVNTCSVTEHSDKKCRNIIRRLHRTNPSASIVVTGCYAQLKASEITHLDGVSLVLGANEKRLLFQKTSALVPKEEPLSLRCDIEDVDTFFPAYSTGERTRSFLKIQDGCDYHCTYCTVPLARGKSRNISIDSIIRQANEIAASGIKEIVLTGVNTGDFGKSDGADFLDLLKALNDVEGIERYRISSIEPNLLRDDILSWIASGTKFLPHFHIPLQAGSDIILAKMKRRYNTTMFRAKIEKIRSLMDCVFFGIDLIVGFPGETDEEFQKSVDFLKEIHPAFVHVFPYSIRPNTPAASFPDQISEQKKKERVEIIERLSEELHEDFIRLNFGREEEVLFESTLKGGMMCGYTRNYIRIERPYDKKMIGKIVKVII